MAHQAYAISSRFFVQRHNPGPVTVYHLVDAVQTTQNSYSSLKSSKLYEKVIARANKSPWRPQPPVGTDHNAGKNACA